ncbi:MAG: hypothetical protein ACR2RE_03910, partial [Geminicoccaceae bacterium]
ALDSAEAKTRKAVKAAEVEAGRSLADMQQIADTERTKALEAEAAVKQMRIDLEATVRESRASGQQALDQAMRAADVEKAAAAEAMAKEAQSRAQIEELRLLIGAEKLAAENARTDLETLRADMEVRLEAERADHEKAKIALTDIRSALTRTLGAEALGTAIAKSPAEPAREDADEPSYLTDNSGFEADEELSPVKTDDPLEDPALDEADIEDREDTNLDLPPIIETALASVQDRQDSNGIDITDLSNEPAAETIELGSAPTASTSLDRPPLFSEPHPETTDDLQVIEGIDSEIEQRLHEHGCYHYRQLAELTSDDLDWLAQAIDVPTYQINADRWIEQAKTLLSVPGDENGAFNESAATESAAD